MYFLLCVSPFFAHLIILQAAFKVNIVPYGVVPQSPPEGFLEKPRRGRKKLRFNRTLEVRVLCHFSFAREACYPRRVRTSFQAHCQFYYLISKHMYFQFLKCGLIVLLRHASICYVLCLCPSHYFLMQHRNNTNVVCTILKSHIFSPCSTVPPFFFSHRWCGQLFCVGQFGSLSAW